MCVNIFVHACVGARGGGGHVGSNYKVLLLTNERWGGGGGECRGEDGEVDLYAVGSQL